MRYESDVQGLHIVYTNQTITVNNRDVFNLNEITNIRHMSKSHAFKFDYRGGDVVLPYEPQEKDMVMNFFKYAIYLQRKEQKSDASKPASEAPAKGEQASPKAAVSTSAPAEPVPNPKPETNPVFNSNSEANTVYNSNPELETSPNRKSKKNKKFAKPKAPKPKGKKRRKVLGIIFGILILVIILAMCDSDSNTENSSEKVTYNSIYKEYSVKIEDAGDKAVKEFKDEASGKSDATALAELANEKVEDIAKVQIEGGEKMADLMYENGDEYSKYEAGFKKLYSVYNDEAMDVYKEYISAYADTIPGMTEDMKQSMLDSLESGLKDMAPMESEN